MRRGTSCAVALIAALLLTRAAAFTVDCNQDYADCDKELSKLTDEDESTPPAAASNASLLPARGTWPDTSPTRVFAPVNETAELDAEDATTPGDVTTADPATTTDLPPATQRANATSFAKGRLLNLSVDELQSFANALHNQTMEEMKPRSKKPTSDLSDVSLDGEEEFDFPPHGVKSEDSRIQHKGLPDSFYSNLQAPFGERRLEDAGAERSSDDSDICSENGVNYKIGERIGRGCEESCECGAGGAWECVPRCQQPYVRRGRRLSDPLCFETPVDECCSIIACATSNDPDLKVNVHKPELCRYGNNSYTFGQQWEVGCEQLCSCGPKSVVTCKPRCAALKASEHCISVQDPHDACCQVQVCDVTHDAHELDVPPQPPAAASSRTTIQDRMDSDFDDLVPTTKIPAAKISTTSPVDVRPISEDRFPLNVNQSMDPRPPKTDRPLSPRPSPDTRLPVEPRPPQDNRLPTENRPIPENRLPIEPVSSLIVLKNSTVQVNLARPNSSENPFHLQISRDKGNTFRDIVLTRSNLQGLEQGLDYVLRSKETRKTFEFTIPITDSGADDVQSSNDIEPKNTTDGCISEGVHYNVGDEFHIGCSELCECVGAGQRECAALECPSHVGLELVSPACVRWAPDPPDWTPHPPACCPARMRCLSDGSCEYRGNKIPNWSEVPISLTGCEQRCFCESGTLDCQDVCSALPPLPPQTLRCQPGYGPGPVNISHDDCCKQWGCIPHAGSNSSTHLKSTYSMHNWSEAFIKPINFVTPLPPPPTTPTANHPIIPPEEPMHPTDVSDPMHPDHDHRQFILELNPMNIYSKYMKHSSPLIKLHSTAENDGIFQMHPKLTHSLNFTKLLRPSVPKAPQKFLGPLSNPFADTYDGYQQNFGDTVGKSPSASKGLKFPMANHLSQEQYENDDKLTQPERPARYTTVNSKPSSDPAAILFPNSHAPRSSNLYHDPAIASMKDKKKNRTRLRYFEPNINLTKYVLPHSKPIVVSNSPAREINITQKSVHMPHTQQIKLGNRRVEIGTLKSSPDRKVNFVTKPPPLQFPQVLQKAPNPYQSVLHRSMPPKPTRPFKYDLTPYAKQELQPTFPSLAVEELLRQLEEVERDPATSAPSLALDRPTPDSRLTAPHAATPSSPAASTPRSPPPAFVPTAPPAIHFPHDDYDEQSEDYEQINHIQQASPQPPVPTPPFVLPPPAPQLPPDSTKLTLMSLVADSPTSVKILFELPSVLVGLRGSVDLRYTDKADEDVSHWYSQVFAPTDEVLTTARLEFRLTGLKPSTVYRLKGRLYLHSLSLEPVSSVYTVRTLDAPPPAIEEKRRPVETALRVVQVNATVAQLVWRHFTEDELQYIDGIQVRYRPLEQPIYSMTELLHHGRSTAELRELRPGARYEAALVLVPPPRSPLELYDPATLNFTTPELHDMYEWSVTLEAAAAGAEAVRVTWRGVPEPPERYVRVYRAAHACDGSAAPRRELDTFKLADRDQPPQLLLTGLRPNTKCRVWLELFLTNGKVKISNVLDVTTKPESSNNELDNEVQASSVAGSRTGSRGDYYGALVVVGVVAALGALTSLLLLLVVVRRHRPHSVSITPVPSAPRAPSLPPYDNPAYKLELQQETMDL